MIRRAVVLMALAASFALAQNVMCVVDNLACYFTGKTQVVDGTLLKEYKCPRGHITWAK